MLSFVSADIGLNQCDAILFTRPEDWPERMVPLIPESLLRARDSIPAWIAGMRERISATDPEKAKEVVWDVGKLYCWKGPNRKVVFPCLGENPDYGAFRDCLDRLKSTWSRLGIRSIAMPRIGTGYGLDWKVMRSMLVVMFTSVNPPANAQATGLHVEVYEKDLPGEMPR